jgi:hypothetical protein
VYFVRARDGAGRVGTQRANDHASDPDTEVTMKHPLDSLAGTIALGLALTAALYAVARALVA